MSVKGRIWGMGRKKAQRVTGRAPDKYRRQWRKFVVLKKRRIERCINEHELCPDYDG